MAVDEGLYLLQEQSKSYRDILYESVQAECLLRLAEYLLAVWMSPYM